MLVLRPPSRPHALALRHRNLVSDAFPDNLPLELGKGQKDVQGQPSHRTGRIELLGHRDEGHAVGVKELNQIGEVSQQPSQSIDLIDNHDTHRAGTGCFRPRTRRRRKGLAGPSSPVPSD